MQNINESREKLRQKGGQVIEKIDQGGFLDAILLGEVCELCNKIRESTVAFDDAISKARTDSLTRSRVELLLKSMEKEDKEQQKPIQFNPETESSYTPEAMGRIIAGLKNDEEKRRQLQENRDRVVDWFCRLAIDETSDPEAAKNLSATQQVIKNASDDEEIIKICELFCQCVKEESFEKIGNIAAENDYFRKLFAISNSEFTPHVERALYFHRIHEIDPDIKKAEALAGKYDIALPSIEQSGLSCGRLQCVTIRSPRNASGFLSDIKQNAKVLPVREIGVAVRGALSSTEISEEFLGSICKDAKVDEKGISNGMAYLLKKGYLLKHSLEGSNIDFASKPLYAATVPGRETLNQAKIFDHFGIKKFSPITSYNPMNLSAMGFIRYSAAFKVFASCADSTTGYGFFGGKSEESFPIIGAIRENKEILIVPAMVSETEQGAIATLLENIKTCLENEEDREILFVTIGTEIPQSFITWGQQISQILREKENISCSVFCTAVEAGHAVDVQDAGKHYSFRELFGGEVAPDVPEEDALTEQDGGTNTQETESEIPEGTFASAEESLTATNQPEQENESEAFDTEKKAAENSLQTVTVSGVENAEETSDEASLNSELDALVKSDDNKAAGWLADGHVAEGLVLLRSQANTENLSESPYAAVAAAFGDPLYRYYVATEKIIESNTIKKYFGGTEGLSAAGALLYGSYWLRKYAMDYSYADNARHNRLQECGLPSTIVNHLNSLLHDIEGRSLQKADLALLDASSTAEALREYAGDLQKKNSIPAVGDRVKHTFEAVLGNNSELGRALATINGEPKESLSDGFKKECVALSKIYGDTGKVKSIVDKKWRQFQSDDTSNRSRQIPNDIYTTMLSKIRETSELIEKWGEVSKEPSAKERRIVENTEKWRKDAKNLQRELRAVDAPQDAWSKVGYCAMDRALNVLVKWYSGDVEGAEAQDNGLYETLQKTAYLPLMRPIGTDYLLPYFPQDRYGHLPQFHWPDKKNTHITDTEFCLTHHLKEVNNPPGKSAVMTREDAEAKRKKFLDDLEIQEAWEHFDFEPEDGKDKSADCSADSRPIKQEILDWEIAYWDSCANTDTGSGDYRVYDRFLKEVQKDCLDLWAEKKAQEFKAKFKDTIQSNSANPEYRDFKKNLEKLLKQGDIPTAREYVKNPEGNAGGASAEDDLFADFLKRLSTFEKYPRIFGGLGRDDPFCNLTTNYIYGVNDLSVSLARKARELSNYWPKPRLYAKENAGNVRLMLMELFGDKLTIENATNARDISPRNDKVAGLTIQRMEYKASLNAKNGLDFANRLPIPEFGTGLNTIDVACILNQRQDDTMVQLGNVISNLCGGRDTGRFLIVLLNRALKKEEWLALAPKLKSLYDRQSFLLIDWSLVLASFSQVDKGRYILRAAAPLHYFNPFPFSSAGRLDPELFVGRKRTVQAFGSEKGSNFLYGGRQLGKTTIFDYIRDTRGAYSREVIQVVINGLSGDEAFQKISKKCREEFQEDELPLNGWSQLCEWLSKKAKKLPEGKKLFLLVDEADAFLDDLRNKFAAHYDSREDPIELLKNVERNESEGKFRFAFAGKQNVYRFTRFCENVQGIDWPGKSIITEVSPFTFAEAKELLDKLKDFGVCFGEKGENPTPLYLQIFNEANYFPGLIHLFCNLLLTEIREKSLNTNLLDLYIVTSSTVKRITEKAEFKKRQRELFWISLRLEKEYQYLAYALGTCSIQDPNGKNAFSAQELLDACRKENIVTATKLGEKGFEEYLNALVGLSVLQESTDQDGKKAYRFKRKMFRDFLRPEGSNDDEEILLTFWGFTGQ